MSEGLRRDGVRFTPPVVSITVAATSTAIYTFPTVPVGSSGTSVMIRKINATNRNAAIVYLVFGETIAAVWTPRLVPYTLNLNQDFELEERMIPNFEFFSAVQARASAAAVDPNDVLVSIEVEIFES